MCMLRDLSLYLHNLLCEFIDGFDFFCSANNVILCAGNSEGILPSKYFAQVIDHRTGKIA